ncbi:MAG: family 20 glycosylhydrolase [Thermoguttaceae bacterium]|nr:family 20 glycosylhydrolase [Thermoguttaceae bacterium]
MMKSFVYMLTFIASAFVALAETNAFEPTDASEIAIYDTRLIPAPTETRYGRGVVVFNSQLRCSFILPNDLARDAEFDKGLETIRAQVSKNFDVDFQFDTKTVDELTNEIENDSARTSDEIEFVKKLTSGDALFKKTNGYQCLAVRDQSLSKDATPEEITERRNDSSGTLLIAASDLSGFRDSFKTLRQLAETFGIGESTAESRYFIPEVEINDAPKLSFRGMHLCWFPETRVDQIERSIRIAAYYKFNYIVLEFWGVFPFESNDALYWSERHTTKDEVRELVAIGKSLGVELIPQMNIFGHAPGARGSSSKHTILDYHPEMEPLFEPDGWTWNVCNPATRELLTKCVLELYETFDKPRYFHIGCDEAYSAGTSFLARRKGNYVDALGDWINYFHDLMKERDCRIMMWHDMLIEPKDFEGYIAVGNPRTRGLIDIIPKDVLICDWQYGKPKENETWPTTTYFMDRGFDVVSCPWNELNGIRSLGANVVEKNSFGMLCTTWHVFYGDTMRNILVVGANWVWGTRYRGSSYGDAFNTHLRQALRDAVHKEYRTNGIYDWQVPIETNVPH